MIRPLLLSLAISFLVSGPARADDPWPTINDALVNTIVDPLGSGGRDISHPVRMRKLWDTLDAAGPVLRDVVTLALGQGGSGKPQDFDSRTLSLQGAELTLLSGGIDDGLAGQFLRLTDIDQEIPGLRGRLSNCSELNEQGCEELNYSRSGALTLGLASCLCSGSAEAVGANMIALNCYFGRGGSYMRFALGYDPGDASLRARLLDDPDLTNRDQLCQSSAAAKRHPAFLLQDGQDPLPMEDPDITAFPLKYIAASVDQNGNNSLDAMTILKHFTLE